MKYVVKAIGPVPTIYKRDYFPRTFLYKKDALECKRGLEKVGGKGEIEIVRK